MTTREAWGEVLEALKFCGGTFLSVGNVCCAICGLTDTTCDEDAETAPEEACAGAVARRALSSWREREPLRSDDDLRQLVVEALFRYGGMGIEQSAISSHAILDAIDASLGGGRG